MERQYYKRRIQEKCYKKATLFSKEKTLDSIYFYEENGTFYEFFTGTVLGTEKYKKDNYAQVNCVYSDRFGYSIRLELVNSNYAYAYKITAADFAEQVQPHLEYRNRVCKVMESIFYDWEQNYAKVKREEAARRKAEEEKKKVDEKNVNWLNNLLDGRKKK